VTVPPMSRALAPVAAALIGLTVTLIGLTVNIHDAEAATEQLPDLRMRRLTNFYIQQASNGDKRLRFTTRIANAGPGRFELHGYRPGTSTARMNIRQRIYNTSGTYRRIEIPRSSTYMFYAGDGHNHWHVHKLQRFEIRRLDANGKEGELKGTGAKTGFCFWDNTTYNLSLPGAPQDPYYTSCGKRGSLNVKMGLSLAGWKLQSPRDRRPLQLVLRDQRCQQRHLHRHSPQRRWHESYCHKQLTHFDLKARTFESCLGYHLAPQSAWTR
jgi:hypothetical protein